MLQPSFTIRRKKKVFSVRLYYASNYRCVIQVGDENVTYRVYGSGSWTPVNPEVIVHPYGIAINSDEKPRKPFELRKREM